MTLIGENFPPPTGGMVQAIEPHLLKPDEAQLVVDCVFHYPGELRNRGMFNYPTNVSVMASNRLGPTLTMTSTATQLYQSTGMLTSGGIPGNKRWLAIVNGVFFVYSDFTAPSTGTTITGLTADQVNSYAWTSEQTPSGITLVTGIPYDPTALTPVTYMWAGSDRPMNSAVNISGTITTTATSTAVVGVGTAFTTDCPVGSFLFNGNRFIGVVKSVTNSTNLVLTDVPYSGALAGVNATSSGFVWLIPRISGGTITTRTTQTVLIGNGTNFAQIPAATTWTSVFTRSDAGGATTTPSTFIGFSQYSAANDNPLSATITTYSTTTATNAAALADNAYWFAYRQDNTHYTAADPLYQSQMTEYAGRYWYAVKDRIYFSSRNHFADVDMSSSGTWFGIPVNVQNPLIRIIGTKNGLMVFLRSAVYVITGTDPSNFVLQKIEAVESLIGPNAVCRVHDGVAWAGIHGIYMSNGSGVQNITQRSFGDAFQKHHGVGTTYRRYGPKNFNEFDAVMSDASLRYSNNYLFLSLNNAARTINHVEIPALETSSTTSAWTGRLNPGFVYSPGIVVYLPTGAAGLWSNMGVYDVFRENDADYIIHQRTSTNPRTVSFALLPVDDVLDNERQNFAQSFNADQYVAWNLNKKFSQGWGTSVATPTTGASWVFDWANLTSAPSGGGMSLNTGGKPCYAYSSKFPTDLAGGAAVGTWVADTTFYGGGYLTPTAGSLDIKSDGTSFSSSRPMFQILFTTNTGITMYFRRTSTLGYRLTVTTGTATMEQVTFTSASSWSVASVDSTYWTAAGIPSTWVLRMTEWTLAFDGTNFAMAGSGLGSATIYFMWCNATSGGFPNATVLSRAFTTGGPNMWLRKFRFHGRVANSGSAGNAFLHSISNHDDWFKLPTTTSVKTLSFTGAVGDEASTDVYESKTAFFGRKAQMWQFLLAPETNANVFVWKFSTLFYKILRGGRQ